MEDLIRSIGGTSFDAFPDDLETLLLSALEMCAAIIELVGIVFILFGFVASLFGLLLQLSHGVGIRRHLANLHETRLMLATYVMTGLEFMIASDIIHTMVSRTLADVAFLGTLIIVRSAISFFLGKEIPEALKD